MARSRNIKPGFFDNEDLAELPFSTRLLFIGLWTLADREGRLEDRPKRIKMAIFPADNVDADEGLSELASRGFIDRYEANGVKVIAITAWHKHQAPHHTEKASTLPDKDGALTVKQPLADGDKAVSPRKQDGGNPPDSLIPDSLIQETKCTHTPLAREWALPKPWGEWAIAEYPHWTPDTVRSIAAQFADHWRASQGTSADWQATWQKWCRDELTQRANAKPREPPKPAVSTVRGAEPFVPAPPLTDEQRASMEAARIAAMAKFKKPALQ